MDTITQFTPSGYVNTLNRTDRMIAFTVSRSPTPIQSQTTAIAPRRRARKAINASRARTDVARSPYPIIVRNSIGTPASTEPGARIVPPTTRNAWIQRSGASATFRGSVDRRGITYQKARSAYATRLNVNWIPKSAVGSMIPRRLPADDQLAFSL